MNGPAYQFLLGSLVCTACVIALFFLRFWRKTRDRLFVFFAISFLLMGIHWLALAFTRWDEFRAALYTLRLLAFILILFAIYDKNRSARVQRGLTSV
jgi:hypothetical protein